MLRWGTSRPPYFKESGYSQISDTRGSQGIGLVIGAAIARQGANVALIARDQDRLDRAVAELSESNGKVIGIAADVTSLDDVERACAECNQVNGPVGLLVNNAGLHKGCGPFREITAEATCVTGYAVGKTAMMRFTESVALEHHCVFAFALLPGLVNMPGNQDKFKREAEMLEAKSRPPEDASEIALAFASGRFDELTGRVFRAGENMDTILGDTKKSSRVISGGWPCLEAHERSEMARQLVPRQSIIYASVRIPHMDKCGTRITVSSPCELI
ncbi:SDR family NAD(P)-dependent oxidoreductase [Devosia rhodophyticola]|uniref:SDR family NAD(P)-dependent oxidoreductase n=1 Tax=Devosia rhodophyticola TaxID=3026423 RepID=A0ABY7Z1L8_9HYPH|nr:SDR family oxidoreductase [Devosia rhodophyticola]WDR07521.1 SDR family NAD(P)-dependent oxidoreductase [Devosia rhodophyticola]